MFIAWQARDGQNAPMFAGLAVTLAMAAAQAAAQPAQAQPPAKPAADACSPAKPDSKADEIVICAPKEEGYRLNPDVLEARREVRNRRAGRPTPQSKMPDTSCVVVGPAGCIAAPMINLLAAAVTAAEMADRLAKGQEIGSMFQTTPEPTEYQLYLMAKARREAEEAEKAAKAKAKAESPAKAAQAAAQEETKPAASQ